MRERDIDCIEIDDIDIDGRYRQMIDRQIDRQIDRYVDRHIDKLCTYRYIN